MLKTVISCGAVVYKKEQGKTFVLLIKQSGPVQGWGIPKGRMEPGETYVRTAIREVKEETGSDIKILTRLPHVVLEKRNYRKIVIPYLAIQTKNSVLRCDHKMSEVIDAKWFDVECLPQIYSYQKPIIDAALLVLGGYLDG